MRREARLLKAKAIASLRRAAQAFNSLEGDGRVTTVLLHSQHSFEMLLALDAVWVARGCSGDSSWALAQSDGANDVCLVLSRAALGGASKLQTSHPRSAQAPLRRRRIDAGGWRAV